MTTRLIPILLAALAITSACNSAHSSNPPLKVKVVTAGTSGYYQKICNAMRQVGSEEQLDIECISGSNGSQENVYRLERREADFALVQSDVAHRAWEGEYPFPSQHPEISLVAPLFTERVHILVKPHQYMTTVSQLLREDKAKVWIGAANSGSRLSAFSILRAADFTRDKVLRTATNSLDSRKAYALLRADRDEDGSVPLDAVIDHERPSPKVLTELLESRWIRSARLCAHGKRLVVPDNSDPQKLRPENDCGPTEGVTILLRPGFTLTKPQDLRHRTLALGKACSRRHRALLQMIEFTEVTPYDSMTALDKLKKQQIDGFVQPPQLSREFAEAVLPPTEYPRIPLSTKASASGNNRLVAFLNPKARTDSVNLAGKRVWWCLDNDAAVEKTLPESLLPRNGDPKNAAGRINLVRDIDTRMALPLLAAGELDAIFQTTVAPSKTITELMRKHDEITMLGIDWSMVQKLVQDGTYVATSLQNSAYPTLAKGVYTVGVQTLLVTNLSNERLDDQLKVDAIARLLHDRQKDIERVLRCSDAGCQNGEENEPFVLTLLNNPLKDQLTGHLHPSAKTYLVQPSLCTKWLQIYGLFLVCIAVAGGVFYVYRQYHLTRPQTEVLIFCVGCAMFWSVGAILLKSQEGEITQDFGDFVSASEAIGLTVLSHFTPVKAPVPTTPEGQPIMNFFSWVLTAMFTAALKFLKALWPVVKFPSLNSGGGPAEAPAPGD